jgi:crotonyl-CoA reductase
MNLQERWEARRLVQTSWHLGKVAVPCMAPEAGSGVTDPELRARFGPDRLAPPLGLGAAGGRR